MVRRRSGAGPSGRQPTWVRPTSVPPGGPSLSGGRRCRRPSLCVGVCSSRPSGGVRSGQRSCPMASSVSTRPLPRCARCRSRCRRCGIRSRSGYRLAWPGDVSRRLRSRRMGCGELHLRLCCRRCCSRRCRYCVVRCRSSTTGGPCRCGSPAPRLRAGPVARTRPTAPRRRGDSAGRSSGASGDSRGPGRAHPGRCRRPPARAAQNAVGPGRGSSCGWRSRWSSSAVTSAATTTPISSVDSPIPSP